MSTDGSKISFDADAMKALGELADFKDDFKEICEGLEQRLRAVEDATRPARGLSRLRLNAMTWVAITLFGLLQTVGALWLAAERDELVRLIEVRSVGRFYLGEGLEAMAGQERVCHGLYQHFLDHESADLSFPTRPGLRDQVRECREAASKLSRELRLRTRP